MKLLYATSFNKTSGLANRFQVMAMVKAFSSKLGDRFYFSSIDFDVSEFSKNGIFLKPAKSFILAFRTIKFARKYNIDWIYSREPFLLCCVSFWKMILRIKVRIAFEVHTMPKGFKVKSAEYLISYFADLHIFLTGHLQIDYKKEFSAINKSIVCHDGVDFSIFDISVDKLEIRKKYKFPQDKKIIGYFGRFKTMGMDKGLSDILRSLKYLPQDVVLLAMGGKKRDRDEYQNLAEELGISQKVIFVEQFNQQILAEHQKAVDIFLMPFPWTKHFAYYMSPLKMFEYMASKRPIIATDLPSIREILDEKTAVIITPDDPKKLSDGILYLLNNPEKGEMLAQNAFLKVKEYTWEKRVERILGFLTL